MTKARNPLVKREMSMIDDLFWFPSGLGCVAMASTSISSLKPHGSKSLVIRKRAQAQLKMQYRLQHLELSPFRDLFHSNGHAPRDPLEKHRCQPWFQLHLETLLLQTLLWQGQSWLDCPASSTHSESDCPINLAPQQTMTDAFHLIGAVRQGLLFVDLEKAVHEQRCVRILHVRRSRWVVTLWTN